MDWRWLHCFACVRLEPDLERPYRCWGYPWVPGLFVLGALVLTTNLWLVRPGRSTIGLFLILAGLPFYRYWTSQQQSFDPPAPKESISK